MKYCNIAALIFVFRDLHPGFFVSRYACKFDDVFCMLKSYSILFGYCNGVQGRTKLPRTGERCSALGPLRRVIENHQISNLSPRRQKSPKLLSQPKKNKKNDTQIHGIPIYVKKWFVQHASHQMLDFDASDLQIQQWDLGADTERLPFSAKTLVPSNSVLSAKRSLAYLCVWKRCVLPWNMRFNTSLPRCLRLAAERRTNLLEYHRPQNHYMLTSPQLGLEIL